MLSKGVCSLDDNLKKEIRKIALQNAVEHDGKTNDKVVLSKSLGTIPELKSNVKDAIPEIASIVSQVNGMSIEEQKTEIENNFPEILNVKEPVKEERVGLPPLEGAEQGKVVTRFTPAPNGYPHIGHAKAAIISEEYTKMYGGKLVLRFDDTNPEDTRLEYWAAIKVGLDWLGIKFDQEKNTSDDIEMLYDKCMEMIKKNNVYICTCKRDTISKNRREMMSCECSAGDVKQNEERWKQMFDKYKPGEYELRNELYHAILDALGMKHPKMLEFSRLEFKGMPVSKRVLRPLIDEGKVSWYDDPRLPTLEALKRRGITPEAIRKFTLSLSLTKADTLAPFDSLEAFNRKIVDGNSIRLFMVKDPRTLKISNLPSSSVELPNHPSNKMGTRKVMVGDSVFLSSEDVKDLKTGDQLRLMGLGNVKITSINSEITGEFTGDEHNVKFMKLQWVSEKNAQELKILIPQQLFVDDKFNEESLEEIQVYTEPHYLELKNDEEIQFVRFGYCRKDSSKQAIFTHK